MQLLPCKPPPAGDFPSFWPGVTAVVEKALSAPAGAGPILTA